MRFSCFLEACLILEDFLVTYSSLSHYSKPAWGSKAHLNITEPLDAQLLFGHLISLMNRGFSAQQRLLALANVLIWNFRILKPFIMIQKA